MEWRYKGHFSQWSYTDSTHTDVMPGADAHFHSPPSHFSWKFPPGNSISVPVPTGFHLFILMPPFYGPHELLVFKHWDSFLLCINKKNTNFEKERCTCWEDDNAFSVLHRYRSLSVVAMVTGTTSLTSNQCSSTNWTFEKLFLSPVQPWQRKLENNEYFSDQTSEKFSSP